MSGLGGVNGTVCNTQQYQQSLLNDTYPTISCLTRGQSIGLALTTEAAFVSLVAVIVVLLLIMRNVLRYRSALPNGDWKLLQGPADIYMFFLFAYDLLQALGGLLDVRWAHNGIVNVGPYCTAQGIIQQTGELGVALITLILTVHTFVVALWKVGIRARRFAFGIVALASLFVALWVGLGKGLHKNFETPTPYWCWIAPEYNLERLAGEYVWFWTALVASVTMYTPLYFWTKGHLSVDPEKWYKFHLSEAEDGYTQSQRRAALGMLCYPLAYSLLVLPTSITRWWLFNHKYMPSAATFFASFVFSLSGAINVLLFLTIRPQLLLFSNPEESVESEVVEIGHLTSGSVIRLQSNGMGLVDDGGGRAWNPSIGSNSVALSRIDSSPNYMTFDERSLA